MLLILINVIASIMILSSLYIYVRFQKLGINGIAIILFGIILLGINSWKDINISIGLQGINANFNTIAKEIKKINVYKKRSNIKQIKQRISIIEIHNAEFDKKKARAEIDNILNKSKITESYKWKTRCENLVKYSERYPLIVKKYNENKAPQIIEACKKAKELNQNNLEYSFLLAIAYHRNQNYEMTIKIIKELANENYAIAQRKLGIMYLFGNLIKQNTNKAKKWLLKSAENGDKASQEIFDENLLEQLYSYSFEEE